MKSFKAKLVVHFVLLSLVPLIAANLGFIRAERDRAAREADRALAVGLRAATTAYAETLRVAQARADDVARRPSTAAALAAGDRAAMARAIAGASDVTISNSRVRVGRIPPGSVRRTATVVQRGRTIGSVTAFVPVDDRVVASLRRRSGLAPPAGLAFTVDGRVAAGLARGARVPSSASHAFELTTGSEPYRALAAPIGTDGVRILALVPTRSLEASSAGTLRGLLVALALALAVIALIAYFEARAIVRALGRLACAADAIAGGRLRSRVPVHGHDELATFSLAFNRMAEQLEARVVDLSDARDKLRASIARFADALTSAHDEGHLAAVVVATAIDATGAAGGAFVVDGQVVFAQGELETPGRIEVPVGARTKSFGTLLLAGVTDGRDARRLAESLASHAAVAFENARLHRTLEQQAQIDELTGLANRRHGSELLQRELVRAERSGAQLAVVLSDIDGFKRVNDAHGHAVGDAVLAAFADVVRSRLREIDVACRWGGEEFLFLLPDTGDAGALEVSEALRCEFAAQFVQLPDGSPLHATASFGVAVFETGVSAEALVARADDALYEAKRAGKDAVVLANVA